MEPVLSFTPAEAWLSCAMAREVLEVRLDDGPWQRPDGHRVQLDGPIDDGGEELHLTLRLVAARAEVRLVPERVHGNAWRDGWVLELVRGDESLILEPGATVSVTDALAAAWTVRVRVKRVAFVAPLGDRTEALPLLDAAFHRHTRQSSAGPRSGRLAWAAPTAPETEPWWEIDLGKGLFVASLAVEIARPAPGTTYEVVAYDFASPRGDPPPGARRQAFEPDAGPFADLVFSEPVLARFVRVRAKSAVPTVLEVTATTAMSGGLFADSLRQTMRRAFAIHGDRAAVVRRDGDGFVVAERYVDLWQKAQALARGLAARLEGRGRVVVARVLRNGVPWLLVEIAAVERGYLLVSLSPDESDERLARILAQVAPSVVVCDPEDAARASRWFPNATTPLVATTDALPVSDVAAPEPVEDPCASFDVLFTSGSTGTPKGAVRTFATFLAMLESYGVAEGVRHLSFQPASHLSERMHLPWLLVQGATIAFADPSAPLLEQLRAFEPTLVSSVPRLFDVLYARYGKSVAAGGSAELALAEARGAFGANVRGVSVGSAPVSPEVLAFMKRCFADLWVTEGYGSTEVGTIAINGRIAAGVDVKLVGPEDGRGEIWVKSAHVVTGYLDASGTSATPVVDDDGYFATGDLGERAADGSIRVVGRARSTVKLAQGEFVSPEPIEGALQGVPGVDRVFVHARAGAPAVSALVFLDSAASVVTVAALRAHGRRAGLAPWQLPVAVRVETTSPTVENGLLTTSGKLARGAIAARYGAELEALLTGPLDLEAAGEADPLALRLARVASGVVGRAVEPSEPLARIGVDSLAAAEVLRAIGEALGRAVPLATWFSTETLADLAARLAAPDLGSGAALAEAAAKDRYFAFPPVTSAPPPGGPRHVLLTGATGLLGAHLLESLLARTGATVTCLVRAPDADAGRARLAAVLEGYGIRAPDDARVRIVAGDLARPDLGLSPEAIGALAGEVDRIVHSGAEVSWLASYESLRAANVEGTLALLAFAARARTKPMHFVSTISVAPASGDEDTMLPFESISAASPYAASKWIAESLVRQAGAAGLPFSVYRPGMIGGHSCRGHGNPDDFVHRYLAGAARLGMYLDIEDATLDMTPVDYVADAIAAALVDREAGGDVLHLVNVARSLSFAGVGRALRSAGAEVVPVDYATFRRALLADPGSALYPLAAYFPAEGFAMGMGPWPSARSEARLAALGVRAPRIDDGFVAGALAAARTVTSRTRG